jgi:hypothetical protein
MFVIVLNSTNIVPDGQNNKLIYKFPNSVNLTNKYIAVSSISLYYSWFNITQTNTNNYFTFTWTAGAVTTTYTVLLPDGFYEITTINDYIQWFCIQNGLYWTLGGLNYYPIEFLVNASRYAIQINTYLIPTTLPVGATTPLNFPGFPTIKQNSVVTIPPNFNVIVGYTPNFVTNANLNDAYAPPSNPNDLVAKNGAGTLSYISSSPPNVQPYNNVLFSITNINNPYSQPSSIIYSLNPAVNVGQQIFEVPPNFMWNKLIDGTYNELRLSLLSNNLQPLIVNDPNMTILLTIRDVSEGMLGTK